MLYYAAPLEGITGYIYRKTHHEFFGGCDRYYMPFIDPKDHGSLMRKEKKDIDPANNAGIPVVPQILTNRADKFLTAAGRLHDLGYKEVNLNLGCPSGTVVSSGKGSGFLAYPDRLRAFFETVFKDPLFGKTSSGCTVSGRSSGPVMKADGSSGPGMKGDGSSGPVMKADGSPEPGMKLSVKTRLGMERPDEILDLMNIYNDYPLCEVIIHARVRTDMYKKPVNHDYFRLVMEASRHPVCYNGDIFSVRDQEELINEFPGLRAIMLGRGLIGNPGLVLELRDNDSRILQSHGQESGAHRQPRENRSQPRENRSRPLDNDGQPSWNKSSLLYLKKFMEVLCDRYESAIGNNALFKMKEIWGLMLPNLPECGSAGKKLMKSRRLSDYRVNMEIVFDKALQNEAVVEA